MPRRIVFIINPVSGIIDKTNIIGLIESAFVDSEMAFDVRFTSRAGHAVEICREEIEIGVDAIVAVGGDGTVNEIAGVLKDTDVVMGIIPSGSGNGLARHLLIPMNVRKAIKVIKKNIVKKIDTATINNNIFVSIAGVGFDGMVARKFAKSKRRGFISYLKIVTEQFPKYKPRKYTIKSDNLIKEERALFITFNNSDQFGYNTAIAPHASVSDGFLDICIAKKPPIAAIPLIAHLLYWRRIDSSKYVTTYKACEITVTSSKSRWVNVDGEPRKLGKELKVKIYPESLNVIVPERINK